MIEAMKLALDALQMPCDRWNAEQSKKVNEAITALEAAIKAAGEPIWFLTEQGQLFATRGAAERMAVGQKIMPLYTHPAKRSLSTARIHELHNQACNINGGANIVETYTRLVEGELGAMPAKRLTNAEIDALWPDGVYTRPQLVVRRQIAKSVMDAMGVKE